MMNGDCMVKGRNPKWEGTFWCLGKAVKEV